MTAFRHGDCRREGPQWVGSVSSSMQEAAVRLLDAVTVSSPPHCGGRTQFFPTAAPPPTSSHLYRRKPDIQMLVAKMESAKTQLLAEG